MTQLPNNPMVQGVGLAPGFDGPDLPSPIAYQQRLRDQALQASKIIGRPRVGLRRPFSQRGFRHVLGREEDSPSGIWPTFVETNFVASALRASYDGLSVQLNSLIGDSFVGTGGILGGPGQQFVAEEFLKSSGLDKTLTPDEAEFLGEADNEREFRVRVRQMMSERRELEAMADMTMGSTLLWGLVGAVTDPTSYIPLFGQSAKVKVGESLIDTIRTAKSASGVRRAVAYRQLATSGKIAAMEGAAIESILQGVNYANRINDDDFITTSLFPSVAMTGAFSGVLGAGAGLAFGRRARRAAVVDIAGQDARLAEKLVNMRVLDEGEALDVSARLVAGADPEWVAPAKRRAHAADSGEIDNPSFVVEEAIAEAINRPQKWVIPESPEQIVSSGAFRSVIDASVAAGKSAAETAGKLGRKIRRAKMGTDRQPDFVRDALGRGISGVAIDNGAITIRITPRDDIGEVVVKLNAKSMEHAPPKAKKGRPLGASSSRDNSLTRVGEDGTVFVDTARVAEFWGRDGGVQVAGPDGKPVFKAVSELFEDINEFQDFVLMHEMMHRIVAKSKRLSREFGELRSYDEEEAFVNGLVSDWKRHAGNPGGPEGREDIVHYMAGDGLMPANESLPLRPGEDEGVKLRNFWRSLGLGEKLVKVVEWWGKKTSPVLRASMSQSDVLKTIQEHLISSVFYREGVTPSGGNGQARTRIRWITPGYKILKRARTRFDRLTRRSRDQVTFEHLEERLADAMSKGNDKDLVRDNYSPIVDEAAADLRTLFDRMNEEMKMYGGKEVALPEGETWFGRIYDNARVREPAFTNMLVEHGLEPEDALKVQENILNYASMPQGDVFGDTRGAFDFGRGDFMENIPYDSLKPFLDTQGFGVAISKLKTLGAELEYRRGMLLAAEALREKGIKVGPLLIDGEDGRVFSTGPLIKAMREEFARKARAISRQEVTGPIELALKFEREIRGNKKLNADFPEFVDSVREFKDWVQLGPGLREIADEAEWAESWLADMVKTVRFMRDIPKDADSIFHVRAPKFIKDLTHSIISGSMAIAQVADFHRSVAERGFRRVFRDEWTVFARDLEGWARRNEMTEEVGLALETQRGEMQRILRNANEHHGNMTKIEGLAARGAQLMSRLNLMGKITDVHQKTISSGVQAFIIDNVPKLLDGSISTRDKLQLQRMGIDEAWAKRLNKAFENGAVKRTDKGTAYFDIDDGWLDRGRTGDLMRVKQAIDIGVEATQTIPTRQELFDWQVQGWGGVMFMYRNWVMASNNRIVASALGNPNAFMMSGMAASIGLGGLVVAMRASLEGDFSIFSEPDELLRRSIESGGYIGMATEANSVVSRVTAGNFDVLPGDGGMRYYDSGTAAGALLGPAWKYPDFVIKSGGDMVNMRAPDRYDVERMKNMTPIIGVFYADWMWNQLLETNNAGGNPEAQGLLRGERDN